MILPTISSRYTQTLTLLGQNELPIYTGFIHGYDSFLPFIPYCCSPPSPRSNFHTGSLHLGQLFHGLHCSNTCVLPVPCTLPLTLCSSYTLMSPSTAHQFSKFTAHWNLLGSFQSTDAWVTPLEMLIILGWNIRTFQTA